MMNDSKELDSVKGAFSWMVFEKPNGFCVAQYKEELTGKLFTAVGNNLPKRKGLIVKLTGTWKTNPKDGKRQFSVSYSEIPRQTSSEGVSAYLMGLKCGVGKVKAGAICSHFGDAVWDIITDSPWRLAEVPGIGASLTQRIVDASRKTLGLKEIIALFSNANAQITVYQANDFLSKHPSDPLGDLKANPYCCCETDGITFEKADSVADYLGFPADHPFRIKAFVTKYMNDAAVKGHVCIPAAELVAQVSSRLMVAPDICQSELTKLWQDGFLRIFNRMVYTRRSYEEETAVVEEICRLVENGPNPIDGLESLIQDYESANFKLADAQICAVKMAFSAPVSIITGGPGTGKTTVIKAVLATHRAVYGDLSKPILLAPTGRAARRMTDAAAYPAQTIHSAVGFRGSASVDTQTALDGNLLIVDESSMMDQYIASVLFSKCPDGCRVVLVGDPDQLPSVGAGNVLLDLIRSGCVPTTRLSVIYRQSGDNPIVSNAHAINEGSSDLIWSNSFKQIVCRSEEDIIDTAVSFYCRCVHAYGMDNVILLNPQRNHTDISVSVINRILQERLNPHLDGHPEISIGKITFRKGDRVMQMKNTDTAKNGDIGYIRSIAFSSSPDDPEDTLYEAEIEFNRDGVLHKYNRDDMRAIDLGYCSTVHKAQGEEYDTVIMIVSKAHPTMLRRNLLYTGITRAKKNLCIITEATPVRAISALDSAIRNTGNEKRNTNLVERLRLVLPVLRS